MWVGEMRGRTLSNAFIIIDEAQNMSNKTMQMVLSRIDSSCKVVVLGSNKQIDNFYVNKYTNALTTLLKSTKNENKLVNTYAIKLQKVLRGPITEWAEEIFSKWYLKIMNYIYTYKYVYNSYLKSIFIKQYYNTVVKYFL